MDSATIQSLLTFASTLAAAVSAVAAWAAMRLSRESAQFEREQGRPWFSFENLRMEPRRLPRQPGEEGSGAVDHSIGIAKGNLKNYGTRPATNIQSSVFIIFDDPNISPIESAHNLTDDFPPGADWLVQFGTQQMDGTNHPGFNIVAGVKYDDPLTQKHYRQLFYARWPGVLEGHVHGDMITLERGKQEALVVRCRSALSAYI